MTKQQLESILEAKQGTIDALRAELRREQDRSADLNVDLVTGSRADKLHDELQTEWEHSKKLLDYIRYLR